MFRFERDLRIEDLTRKPEATRFRIRPKAIEICLLAFIRILIDVKTSIANT